METETVRNRAKYVGPETLEIDQTKWKGKYRSTNNTK